MDSDRLHNYSDRNSTSNLFYCDNSENSEDTNDRISPISIISTVENYGPTSSAFLTETPTPANHSPSVGRRQLLAPTSSNGKDVETGGASTFYHSADSSLNDADDVDHAKGGGGGRASVAKRDNTKCKRMSQSKLKCCQHDAQLWRSEDDLLTGRREQRLLAIISFITFFFICTELVGGYLAHSLAIMTDAFHMISDLSSFIISIIAIHLSRKRPTAKYPYGFQRAEVLGALISVMMIWVLTVVLVYMAILRIVEADYEVDTGKMIFTACAGVLFNLVIGVLLFFGKSSGGHNHSHFGLPSHTNPTFTTSEENIAQHKGSTTNLTNSSPTLKKHRHDVISAAAPVADASNAPHHHHHNHHAHVNLNIRAAFVHVVGDLVQSVGVLAAALIIKFTGFALADPICTFLFSILVLMTTTPVMKDISDVLMEATPSHLNASKIYADLMLVNGVIGVHNMKIWALKLDSLAISLHLEMANSSQVEEIVTKTYEHLRVAHKFDFITVQTQCHSTSQPNGSTERV